MHNKANFTLPQLASIAGLLVWLFSVHTVFAAPSGTLSARLGPELKTQAKIQSTVEGAEVLYAIEEATLHTNGHWQRQRYYSIRINNQEAARDYGRLSIGYNHFYSTAQLSYANVLSPSGEIKAVSPDAVQVRVTGGGQDFYDDRSEIVFSLPDVAVGSIIEFQYHTATVKRAITTLDNDGARPYWFQRKAAGDGWRADAVRDFTYRLNAPTNRHFFSNISGNYNPKPKVTHNNDISTREWHWRHVREAVLEPHMLPNDQVLAGIDLSTSQDWSLVSDWTWQKVEDKLGGSQKLETVIKALALPKTATHQDKIKAVYAYLQNNVRYVFAHLGRGGYEPHHPDETLNNGYGDCKDQTVLAIALLRTLGVEAYPVLVETPGAGRSNTELVKLIFDHMLVWIPATETTNDLWMDTTGDHSLFPGLSNYLIGQNALIVNGRGGELKTVDAQVERNIANLSLEYRTGDAGATVVNAIYTGSGIFEQNLRQWWIRDNNRESSLPRFLNGVFENKGQYTLSADVLHSEDLFKPAQVTASFVFAASEDSSAAKIYGASFNQIYRLVGELSAMQTPESRQNRWYEPISVNYRFTSRFVGSQQTQPAVLKNPASLNNPYFSVEQTGSKDGNDYLVNMHFTRPALNLSVTEYEQYYTALLKLAELETWIVRMHPNADQEGRKAVQNAAMLHGEDSAEHQLQKAKQHLEQGDFSEALEPANEAVKLNPENGEAWFVLGTAQGFNSLIEESSHSFEQAKRLGYLP